MTRPSHLCWPVLSMLLAYDVSGNAYEWTNDRFSPDGYGSGPLTNPVHGVEVPSDLTPTTAVFEGGTALDPGGFPAYRIYRGGSFDMFAVLGASGRRLFMSVATQHTGFRVARSLFERKVE